MAAHEQDGPWVLDTRELVRRPGTMRRASWTVEAPERIGTDVVAIPPGREVELDLRLESVVEAAGEHGLTPLGATVSGVRGAKGNTEFFVRLGLPGNARTASPSGWMKDLVESAGGDENE